MTRKSIFRVKSLRSSLRIYGFLCAALASILPLQASSQQATRLGTVTEKLAGAGIGEHRGFPGKLMRALTEDGSTIVMLVTRRDLSDEAALEIDRGELRERLQAAGFLNVEIVEDAGVVVGDMDARTAVIIMPAETLAHPVDTQATMPPPPPGAPDFRELPGAGFDTVPSPPGVGETLR